MNALASSPAFLALDAQAAAGGLPPERADELKALLAALLTRELPSAREAEAAAEGAAKDLAVALRAETDALARLQRRRGGLAERVAATAEERDRVSVGTLGRPAHHTTGLGLQIYT